MAPRRTSKRGRPGRARAGAAAAPAADAVPETLMAAIAAAVSKGSSAPIAALPAVPVNLTRDEAVERMEELYARLSDVACKGLCHATCTVIPATELERQRVEDAGSSLGPRLSARGVQQIYGLLLADTPTCPALGPMRNCTVYPVRPSVCRAYGVVEGLRCPFGCAPAQLMSDEEFRGIRRELEALSYHVTGIRSSCS